MASTRGRDLTVSVLSDVDQFDLTSPARELDDLGRSASDTGRDLDDLDRAAQHTDLSGIEKDAKSAGSSLDTLDTSGAAAAKGLADSFDKIKTESKQASRALGDDAKHGMSDAGEATATFKDEAKANLSEVASSFQGDMTSAVDLVQGTLGGVVQDLGPLGLALGAAGAAGLGLIASSITEAKERVTALTQSFLDLRKQGIDPAADSASHLVDELDAADLAKYKRDADELGLSYDTLKAAFDGNADAIARARKAVKEYNDENATGNPYTGQQADLHADLTLKLNETEKAYRNAADASKFLGQQQADSADAAEAATAALDAHAAALDAFVDPVSVYTTALADKRTAEQESAQATADATEDQKDSWEDYAKSVDLSVDEYLDALERQVKAQEDWAANLDTLAKRGVEDGVLAELERMGPEGAPLVAKLTKASDAELQRMVTLYGRQGAAAGQAVAENLEAQTGAVRDAAAAMHSGAARIIGGKLSVPVGIENRVSMSDAQRLRYDIANQIGTVVVPVRGENPYTNNANNSRYRW